MTQGDHNPNRTDYTMNPSLLTQSSTGIPGGPLPVRGTTKKSTHRKPVAAVIRPVPRQLGKEGSLRIDPANSSPLSSHARGYSLSDYVTWLRQKIEAGEARDKQENQSSPEAPVQLPPEQPPASSAKVTDGIFSSITDTDLVQVLDDRHVSTATTKGVRFEEIASPGYGAVDHSSPGESYKRIDLGHPAESPSPSELSRKAMFPYAEMFDLSKAPQEPSEVAGGDTQAFINAVSKAIASVITEMPEPVFEQRGLGC